MPLHLNHCRCDRLFTLLATVLVVGPLSFWLGTMRGNSFDQRPTPEKPAAENRPIIIQLGDESLLIARPQHAPVADSKEIAGFDAPEEESAAAVYDQEALGEIIEEWELYWPLDSPAEATPDSQPPESDSRIFTQEEFRRILEEWERIWDLDMPDHQTPFRTHGGVI